MPIKYGDRVKIHYKGMTDDNIVFDSTYKHGKPLKMVVGDGKFLDGIEEAILGMEVGNKKKIHLTPENAYGVYNESLVQTIKRNELPTKSQLSEGDLVVFNLPSGQEIPARILQVQDDEFLIDMNHPLAGIALTFEIEIIDIISLNEK